MKDLDANLVSKILAEQYVLRVELLLLGLVTGDERLITLQDAASVLGQSQELKKHVKERNLKIPIDASIH